MTKKRWFAWRDRVAEKWFCVLKSGPRGMPRLLRSGGFGFSGDTAFFDSIKEANAAARKALQEEET